VADAIGQGGDLTRDDAVAAYKLMRELRHLLDNAELRLIEAVKEREPYITWAGVSDLLGFGSAQAIHQRAKRLREAARWLR